MLEHACRFGLEGIISKRAALPYRSGRGELVLGLATPAYKKHRMTVSGFTITKAFTMRGEIR